MQSILGRGGERLGMVAAVLRGGRILAQDVAGVRKKGTEERITLADRFHLGSCTKAMTATLVAMLVEEGRLNWTTTLGGLIADTAKPMRPADRDCPAALYRAVLSRRVTMLKSACRIYGRLNP